MNTNRFVAAAAPPHIAQALLRSNLSIPALRALSPLQEDAQRAIDRAVVRVGLDRLVIAADLLAAGLTYPLPNALSVMELQWEQVSKSGGAQRTMSPAARGEHQLQARRPKRIPIYLTTDDFSVGIRFLQASQRIGAPIDTSLVEDATRRVNEAIEDATINGAGIAVDGNQTPGILNAPNVNTYSYGGASGKEAWDHADKTGQQILDDVLAMVAVLQANKKFGPYNLYVNTAYDNKLNKNFVENYPTTIRQRLEQVVVGGRNLVVRAADKLPAHRTVLMQMTSDVIDMITGLSPTVIPWTSADGFTLYWMVMAIMVPRVRDDYEGNSGIVVGNTPS